MTNWTDEIRGEWKVLGLGNERGKGDYSLSAKRLSLWWIDWLGGENCCWVYGWIGGGLGSEDEWVARPRRSKEKIYTKSHTHKNDQYHQCSIVQHVPRYT